MWRHSLAPILGCVHFNLESFVIHYPRHQIRSGRMPAIWDCQKSLSPIWSCLYSFLFDFFDWFFANFPTYYHLGPDHLSTRSPHLKIVSNSSFVSGWRLADPPPQTGCLHFVHRRPYSYSFICLSFYLGCRRPHFAHLMCLL